MHRTNRLAGGVLAVALAAMVVIVPLANVSAIAQMPPVGVHWGQSPYFPVCTEGPCRVVIIADKIGDPQMGTQIRRWAAWMNYVRTVYNIKLPAFGVVSLTDPTCATAEGVITVCDNTNAFNADCPSSPAAARCTSFTVAIGTGHMLSSRATFRPQDLTPADAWTLVCGALGRSIGMQPSDDGASCLQDDILLGTGEKYYVGTDWTALFSMYDHAAVA